MIAVRRLALLPVLVLILAGCATTNRHTTANLAAGDTAAATSVTVVAAGDIACPPGMRVTPTQCKQASTARVARGLAPSVALPLGDEQYQTASAYDFAHSYALSWGTLRSISRPVPGNHEYMTSGASGYYSYFSGRQPGSPGYYRVAAGTWQLYLLNSNCDKISCLTERRWLAAQLAAHPSTCALIAMHHPRFSSGGEHGNDPAVTGLWTAAYKHNVDVALAGHDHDYERFTALDPSGRVTSRGIASFVVGTGGRSHYPRGTRKTGSRYFNNSSFGVLRMVLGTGAVSWSFRTIGGRTLDAGSLRCH